MLQDGDAFFAQFTAGTEDSARDQGPSIADYEPGLGAALLQPMDLDEPGRASIAAAEDAGPTEDPPGPVPAVLDQVTELGKRCKAC